MVRHLSAAASSGGVTTLNGLAGAVNLTSTGATISITPVGNNIDLEVIGGSAVTSVSNADGTLTISPTTGAVVASRAGITGDISIPVASNTATLATVNSNVGTFGTASSVATFTVNAKGLNTAASNTAIQITENQVINLTTDLAGKQPLDADLTAIAALSTTGFPSRTAANIWALRTFQNSVGIIWTNPAGIAGDPSAEFSGTDNVFFEFKNRTLHQIKGTEISVDPNELSVLELTVDPSGGDIAGIKAPVSGLSRLLYIYNADASLSFRLLNLNGSASANNRLSIGGDIRINAQEGVTLLYDVTNSKWMNVGLGKVPATGTVTSVSGTTNRITSTGGATPIIDISASYVGQSSITTVGTLTSGSTGAGFTVALGSSTITGDLAYANLTQGTARSLLAVTGNATADWAPIQGTADQVPVINSAGTALVFGQVATGGITDNSVTYAKIQQVSTGKTLANITGSTANLTEQNFNLENASAYGGTLTFSGGVSPSGASSITEGYTITGNAVQGWISAVYAVAGTSVTNFTLPIPTTWPTPLIPTGFTGASVSLWIVQSRIVNTPVATSSISALTFIFRNAGNTGFDIRNALAFAASTIRGLYLQINYPIQ